MNSFRSHDASAPTVLEAVGSVLVPGREGERKARVISTALHIRVLFVVSEILVGEDAWLPSTIFMSLTIEVPFPEREMIVT